MQQPEDMMYCTTATSNLASGSSQSGFHHSGSYVGYPPTSVSQNMVPTASYSSSTSGAGGPTIFSWAHTVPTYMPWAPKQEQCPSVVRFTAPAATTLPCDPCTSQTATTWELLHNLGNFCSHSANQHLKRRSDLDSDDELSPTRPVKQYISEEKMAAKLSQMHISSNNNSSIPRSTHKKQGKGTPTKKTSSPSWTAMSEDGSEDSEDVPPGSLVLSPELKRLMQPNPHLVKALLHDSSKASMAVVLWQPPGGSISDKVRQMTSSPPPPSLCMRGGTTPADTATSSGNEGSSSSNNNNNDSLSSNLNLGTQASFIPLSFQPSGTLPDPLDEIDDMEL